MKVFKFGGASVKDSVGVRNLKTILEMHRDEHLVVVVSAMGKTTNALEELLELSLNGKDYFSKLDRLKEYHIKIVEELLLNDLGGVIIEIERIFEEIKNRLETKNRGTYDFDYDQLISFGEILSTKIISVFLNNSGINNLWVDARKLIRTDDNFREGKVDWKATKELVDNKIKNVMDSSQEIMVFVTQGFIGHTANAQTTTLGREGSDFTAAILGYILNPDEVTIWKDVPGVLNADPKKFEEQVLLERISFKEAIELSFYGASVIHPKTIKPLQNKGIPLKVKSFLNPTERGTVIQESTAYDGNNSSFIIKENQLLISIQPKDFSFIVEENLSHIFEVFASAGVKINMMQNSAISFSVCVNFDKRRVPGLIETLKKDFVVKYNDNLELVTIRHYNESGIQKMTSGKEILLEQKSRDTARFVVRGV